MTRALLPLAMFALWPNAAGAAGGTTGSESHPQVELQLDPCVPTNREAVRRVLGIELGALLDDAPGATSERTRVQVVCRDELLELRVDDPITRKSLSRDIDLRAAAEAGRARLLGLAIAELVSASWSELVANPEPRVPPAGPPPSPASRESARAALRRAEAPPMRKLQLAADVVGRGTFAGSGFLAGGGLRLARYHARHLGWLVDLEVVHGRTDTSLGAVSTDVLSIGTAFLVHQSWSRLGLHAGVGLRAGAARLAGDPRAAMDVTGRSLWGGWLGPMATLGLAAAPTRRLLLELGLEGGYVVVPVGGLVNTRREVALDGGWIGFQLGVGVFL